MQNNETKYIKDPAFWMTVLGCITIALTIGIAIMQESRRMDRASEISKATQENLTKLKALHESINLTNYKSISYPLREQTNETISATQKSLISLESEITRDSGSSSTLWQGLCQAMLCFALAIRYRHDKLKKQLGIKPIDPLQDH